LYKGKGSKKKLAPWWMTPLVTLAGEQPSQGVSRETYNQPPYPLRSLPQSQLLLHSPLRSPHRRRHKPSHHLVSAPLDASTEMFGVEVDPEALSDSDKLTRILTQITTTNTHGLTPMANGWRRWRRRRLSTPPHRPSMRPCVRLRA
jgi:hypothetical protein